MIPLSYLLLSLIMMFIIIFGYKSVLNQHETNMHILSTIQLRNNAK